ncbi:hypothetical protein FACS1894211_11810 [Clostridia bacterium]|nr:hypothetical protein FACS1894211_11810 [Clostridia bacterium]
MFNFGLFNYKYKGKAGADYEKGGRNKGNCDNAQSMKDEN